jgi:hypothetical protein
MTKNFKTLTPVKQIFLNFNNEFTLLAG